MSTEESILNNENMLFKIKEGEILRYKKRLFTKNWRSVQLTLYNNASLLIVKPRAKSSVSIMCEKNSTLIIFGQQLNLVPNRPNPPSCFKLEQMFAIGLVNHMFNSSGLLKRTKIIFYWFCLPKMKELLEWIFAFQKVISMQKVLFNSINLNNQQKNQYHIQKNKKLDDIYLSMLMLNSTVYNNSLNYDIPSLGTNISTIDQFQTNNSTLQPMPSRQNLLQFQQNINDYNILNNNENYQTNSLNDSSNIFYQNDLLNNNVQLDNTNYIDHLNNSNNINLINNLHISNCEVPDFDISTMSAI